MTNFDLKTFSRRIGRKLSLAKKNLLEQFLPDVLYDYSKFKKLINDYEKINLEIGFGGGEHLIGEAIKKPNELFIGCEPYLNMVAKVLSFIDRLKLSNIMLYPDDALILLKQLDDNILNHIYILYPDPWPKPKQRKRRIINEQRLKLFHDKLIKAGKLIVATDHKEYASYIVKTANKTRLYQEINENTNLNKTPSLWITTKYEMKAIAGESSYILLNKL